MKLKEFCDNLIDNGVEFDIDSYQFGFVSCISKSGRTYIVQIRDDLKTDEVIVELRPHFAILHMDELLALLKG